MLRLSAPFQSLLSRVLRARDQFAQGRRKLLEALGLRLVRFAKESAEIRSAGGTAAGITWRPLDRDTLKEKARKGQGNRIGIATGLLFESAEAEVGTKGFALRFRAAHAPYFSRRRPLLPDSLPAEWQTALEEDVEAWAHDTLTANLEGR